MVPTNGTTNKELRRMTRFGKVTGGLVAGAALVGSVVAAQAASNESRSRIFFMAGSG